MKTHAEALHNLGINHRLILNIARGGRLQVTDGIALIGDRKNPKSMSVEVADTSLPATYLHFEETPEGVETTIQVPNAGSNKRKPDAKLMSALSGYIQKQLSRDPAEAGFNYKGGTYTRHMVTALTGQQVAWDDSDPNRSLRNRKGELHWGGVLRDAMLAHSEPATRRAPLPPAKPRAAAPAM